MKRREIIISEGALFIRTHNISGKLYVSQNGWIIDGFEQHPNKSFPFLCSPISSICPTFRPDAERFFAFLFVTVRCQRDNARRVVQMRPLVRSAVLYRENCPYKLDNLISELLMILCSQKLTLYPKTLHIHEACRRARL